MFDIQTRLLQILTAWFIAFGALFIMTDSVLAQESDTQTAEESAQKSQEPSQETVAQSQTRPKDSQIASQPSKEEPSQEIVDQSQAQPKDSQIASQPSKPESQVISEEKTKIKKQYQNARREADAISDYHDPELVQTPMQSALEKSISVVEPRPFEKTGHGEFAFGLSTIASDIFVVYLPVSLRGGYHFKEWVSLELAASFMGCFSNETGDDLTRGASQKCMRFMTPGYDHLKETANQTQLRSITIDQYQVARFVLNPIFSPFNGKFSLMNSAIVHYDLNVTAGLGVQILETLDKTNIGSIQYGASFEGNFGLGIRFIFVDFVGLRIDFREYLYEKKRNKSLGTASEFGLSVSFLL